MMTARQTETLHAVVNRLIPSDEWPGGWDAGVGDYLTRLWQREPTAFVGMLAGLDALAAENFAALTSDAQDIRLTEIERAPDGRWLTRLASQCWEGFWADPGNGGNKDSISWKMIGFEVTA